MERMKKHILSVAGNLLAILTSLIVMIPMIVVVLTSFKSSGEANNMSLTLPKKWMFENYAIVIEQGKLISSFLNGLIYATFSVLIIILVVSAAAFVISRNFKGINKFIYYFIIAGIAMPINNVALMKVMQALHLVNQRYGRMNKTHG